MWKVTLVSVFWVSLGARLADVERKNPKLEANELAAVSINESPENANQVKERVVVNFDKDDKPGVVLGRGNTKATMLREHEAGTIISIIEPKGILSRKGLYNGTTWHVVKINEADVSHVGPMAVQSLWVKKMHSQKPYTVTFDLEISDLEHRGVLYVGAFPALLALIVTCCALPPFLWSIWKETALANPRPPMPPGMEITDDLEEAPQLARPCYLADVIDHPVTRYTLMFFFLYSLFDSIRLSIPFISFHPLAASIHISDAALILSMSIVLEFGRQATQQNPLIVDPQPFNKDKAMSMSEKLVQRLPKLYKQKANYARCEAGLTEVMTKELKYGMYLCLPTVMMCFFVAGHGIVFIAIHIESDGFQGGMAMGAVACSDVCYFCLLRLCILKFMLDNYIVSSVARISVDTAVAKLQHLVEKLCGQGDQDEQETSPQTLQEDVEKAVIDVHLCAVDLAERVLPALQKIGASALGFAVVSWTYSFTWVFSFLANDMDSIKKQPIHLVSEVLGIMLTSLPLGLMCLIPPASVSDACDNLVKQMNKLRSFETIDDLSLRKTERFIKEANGGQGLGFVLWGTGTVVNRKLLFSVFLKIFALASVLVGSINTLMKLQSNLQKELKTVEQTK